MRYYRHAEQHKDEAQDNTVDHGVHGVDGVVVQQAVGMTCSAAPPPPPTNRRREGVRKMATAAPCDAVQMDHELPVEGFTAVLIHFRSCRSTVEELVDPRVRPPDIRSPAPMHGPAHATSLAWWMWGPSWILFPKCWSSA